MNNLPDILCKGLSSAGDRDESGADPFMSNFVLGVECLVKMLSSFVKSTVVPFDLPISWVISIKLISVKLVQLMDISLTGSVLGG